MLPDFWNLAGMIKTLFFFFLAVDGFQEALVSLPHAHVFILYIRDFFSLGYRQCSFKHNFLDKLYATSPTTGITRKDDFYKSKGIENIFINLPFF